MRIAVCDDNLDEQKLLSEYLRNIITDRNLECEINSFESGDSLLAARQDSLYDIYLLDIYMSGVTGVQAAYTIKESQPGACIVFTTSSADHMADGFDVGAVHYVVKPITYNAVGKAIDRCLPLLGSIERYVTLQVDRIERKVLLSEILVAESLNKYCRLTTKTGAFQSYIRLDEIAAMLNDPRFLRCHRSYLINMDYASGIVNDGFKMTNGTLIPIKRGMRQKMKEAFREYSFDKLRKDM